MNFKAALQRFYHFLDF